MRLTRLLKWTAPLVLSGMAGAVAIGCASEAQISGQIQAAPPPPPDSDGDGILDPVDKCPKVKEDGLPPNPKDGCPNLDADGDGIPIPQDKCPNKPETKNGYQDEDGCPDKKPLVQIVGTKVQINQKIMFAKNSAKIESESMPVVDAVADILKKNADIELVEVGGYASKEGSAYYNRSLTQRRVDSVVKALTDKGVTRDRLLAQGYGFYCRLDASGTETGREKNRRVEFKILERKGKWTDEKRGCDEAAKAGIKPKALPALKAWPPKATKRPAAKAVKAKKPAAKAVKAVKAVKAKKPAVKAATPAKK